MTVWKALLLNAEVSPYSTAVTVGSLRTQIRPFDVEFLRTS
jgi:hypothetical protein